MKAKRFLHNVIAVAFMVSAIIVATFSGVGITYAAETAYADEVANESKIISELERVTIDGKKFAVEDYPANADGVPYVLYLNEMGYDGTSDTRGLYGLTLYVYNPTQINVVDDTRNQIQMRIGSAERFSKYDIKLSDISADKLFCKFSVEFKSGEKEAALATLSADGRAYEVSTIELYVDGWNATDFPVAYTRIFTYKGYAAGLGGNAPTESTLGGTLSYTITGGSETKKISVRHTSWRPEGTNGNSSWTQDTIHSVYFAVKKEFDEQYDYLYSIKASWAEALLNPVYVTDNKELIADLETMYQYDLANARKQGYWRFDTQFKLDDKTDFNWAMATWTVKNSAFEIGYNQYFFGRDAFPKYTPGITEIDEIKVMLRGLPLFAEANDGYVTANELANLVRSRTSDVEDFYAYDKVENKYPADLFQSYTNGKITKIIRLGEKTEAEKDNELIVTSDDLILHSEEVKRAWWQKIAVVENEKDFEGIDAIKLVTDEDNVLNKTPKQLGDSLYISERDAQSFKDFYEENSAENNIYIMRFAVSEYWCQATHEYSYSNLIPPGVWSPRGTRADKDGYFAYDTCYFNFDIIDFEYMKNDKSYIVPVSMSPVDIFPELTPPPEYESNGNFWKYGLAIIGGLVAVGIVYGIISRQAKKRGKS